MKGGSLWYLLRQDMAVVYRNGYVYVVVVLAVLFILPINFAIPKQLKVTAREYMVDQTVGRLIAPLARSAGLEESLLNSEEELRQALEQDSQAVGIVFQGGRENPKATIYRQGNEAEKAMRGLEAAVISFWNTAGNLGQAVTYRQELLHPESEKPPFNLGLVPFVLAFESALIGIFFVSALVFQEKEEGSIRAFQISPAGTWPYIISKITVNVLLSLLPGFLLFVFTLGLRPELPAVLLLVALVGFLMTAFGLAISVFFKSLSEFEYVLAVIMTVVSMPMVSYFMPSFSAAFFPFIPTYPLMFSIRELVFSTGKTGFFLPMLLILAAEVLVVLVLSRIAVERKLMKKGHIKKGFGIISNNPSPFGRSGGI